MEASATAPEEGRCECGGAPSIHMLGRWAGASDPNTTSHCICMYTHTGDGSCCRLETDRTLIRKPIDLGGTVQRATTVDHQSLRACIIGRRIGKFMKMNYNNSLHSPPCCGTDTTKAQVPHPIPPKMPRRRRRLPCRFRESTIRCVIVQINPRPKIASERRQVEVYPDMLYPGEKGKIRKTPVLVSVPGPILVYKTPKW
jgi:hypothetical protein